MANRTLDHVITTRQAAILLELSKNKKFNELAANLEHDDITEFNMESIAARQHEIDVEMIELKPDTFRATKALMVQFYLIGGQSKVVTFSSKSVYRKFLIELFEKTHINPKRSVISI